MYGPFGNLFPYSDQHALNLDWIIQVAKDFLDQYTHIQEIISDGETSLDQHTTDGLAALAAEKTRLEGLLNAWYITHSEDIAGQLTQAITDFQTAAQGIGAAVIESIPEDYTTLSNHVTKLDNAIDGDIADLIKLSIRGANLYDIATDTDNLSISNAGAEQSSVAYRTSDYIYIGKGGTFTLPVATAISESRAGVQYIAVYDEYRVFTQRIDCTDETGVKTITLGSSEAMVRLVSPMITGDFMCNMGSSLLTYVPFNQKLISVANTVTKRADILGESVHSKNLFNPKTATVGANIGTNGAISESVYGSVTDYIYIGAGGKFTTQVASAIQRVNPYYMATYDVDFNFKRRVQITDANEYKTITLNPDEVYVRMVYGIKTADFMCNLGESLLTYKPFYEPIINTIYETEDTVNRNSNYRFSNIEIPNFYENGNAESVAGTDLDAGTVNTGIIYGLFDDLVTANSDYITKEDLGVCSDGVNHVYLYKFIPEEIGHLDQDAYPFISCPKVIIFAGIHGYDTDAGNGDPPMNTVCLYYWLKDLCDNWRTNPALYYLRWNIQFYIVPVLNPYGFNGAGRYNYNGVDLNRNFSYGWTSGEHNGSAAMSEVETQMAADLIDDNTDAIYTIDFHCTGGSAIGQSRLIYTATLNMDEMAYPLRDTVRILSNAWYLDPDIPNFTALNYHGFVGSRINPRGYLSHYSSYMGVPGMIVENWQNYTDSGINKNTQPIIKMGCEEIGNMVLNNIKYFETNRRYVTNKIRTE